MGAVGAAPAALAATDRSDAHSAEAIASSAEVMIENRSSEEKASIDAYQLGSMVTCLQSGQVVTSSVGCVACSPIVSSESRPDLAMVRRSPGDVNTLAMGNIATRH